MIGTPKTMARGLFYWGRIPTYYGGPTVYAVYSDKDDQDVSIHDQYQGQAKPRNCLGVIVRSEDRRSWEAYAVRSDGYWHRGRKPDAVCDSRAGASIAIIHRLNRFKYGRRLLDRAKITEQRLPR